MGVPVKARASIPQLALFGVFAPQVFPYRIEVYFEGFVLLQAA